MNERRIARIESQIKERIATVLIHEIADPRMGFVTITRVEVDKEMQRCIVYWSLIGDATRLRTETGWGPHLSFDRTLDDILDYWRSVERA